MNQWTIQAVAYFDHSYGELCIAVRRVSQDRQRYELLGEFGWTKTEPGEYHRPAIMLDKSQATALLESLRSAGVKGEADLQSEGHRGALEFHLDDMRRLLAHSTGAVLPERKR